MLMKVLLIFAFISFIDAKNFLIETAGKLYNTINLKITTPDDALFIL